MLPPRQGRVPTTSESVTSPSSLLRAHAPDHHPPPGSGLPRRTVFAGCCQPLLEDGPSRRYPRRSFAGCLHPYRDGIPGALARFFPGISGLPQGPRGSASRNYPFGDFRTERRFAVAIISSWFRPPALLATQVAPTAVARSPSGRPWLLRPGSTWVVTFPRSGYATRLSRATDGEELTSSRSAVLSAAPRTRSFASRGSPPVCPSRLCGLQGTKSHPSHKPIRNLRWDRGASEARLYRESLTHVSVLPSGAGLRTAPIRPSFAAEWRGDPSAPSPLSDDLSHTPHMAPPGRRPHHGHQGRQRPGLLGSVVR